MTLDDLKDYKVVIRKPISIEYRGHKFHACGAPSGGSTALSIFKIIEGYNMSDPELSHLNTHRLDEAMRFSYGARTHLGDPDFFDYMDDFESKMIESETSEEIRRKISDQYTHNVSHYDPQGYAVTENHGTSHMVAVDGSGMTISFTSTVNLIFGSQLMVPETGIIMNNEMNDFSIPGVTNEFGFAPSPINYIRPKKRPLSSMTPIIVERSDGSLYISIGAAGGSRIITATMQGIWHVIDHGMTLVESVKQPRMHDQLLPAVSTFERSFDMDTVKSMVERGHNISWVGYYQSAVQGVRVLEDGTLEAASEPRQVNSGGLSI
jgi:gamma-glutamyltranspeptidase/glutathione hydrolase